MKRNTHGASRVSHDVQRSLSRIISELKDPRIAMMTSVTRCNVSRDLKDCKAYISVLGNSEDSLNRTMEGLNSAKGFIRKSLAESLNLRNTPELTFISDDSIAYGVEMSRKIDEVIEQDKLNAVPDEESESEDESDDPETEEGSDDEE